MGEMLHILKVKEVFSMLAIVSSLTGTWVYIRMGKSDAKSNIVVLFVWFIFSLLNAYSYSFIVHDYYKAASALFSVVVNAAVIIITLFFKDYLFLKRDVLLILVLFVFSVIVFFVFDVKDLHILTQICLTIPFFILIWRIVQKKGVEPFRPWLFYTLALVFALGAVLVDYSDYWSLIHYSRALICQIIVLIIIKKYSADWEYFFCRKK